jgi:hypothetical protein
MGYCATEMSAVSAILASSDPVDVLLELLDNGNGTVPARTARERLGESLVYLERIGAVQPDAILSEVTCQECHLNRSAAIEFGSSRHTYQFFCPEAGLIAISDTDAASLCVKPDWLLDWLARSLSLTPQIRRRTLIENRAWLLGETALDAITVTVALVLGRLAANEQDAVIQGLSRFQPSEIGILLTSSAELNSALLALYRYHALDLREVIRAHEDGLTLDCTRLTARAVQFLRGTKPTKGSGGRPSRVEKIRKFFAERRKDNVPYRHKSVEATEIRNAWAARFPGEKVPGHSTIRNLLPDSHLAANEDPNPATCDPQAENS